MSCPSEPTDEPQGLTERVEAGLPAVAAHAATMPGIVCAGCGRERTLADDYDYTPLQVFTGRKLGWFNGEGEQMCGECLAATMRGERP
jgi:hypothetical protein